MVAKNHVREIRPSGWSIKIFLQSDWFTLPMSMLNTSLLLEPNPVPSLKTVKLSSEIDPLLPCLEVPRSVHIENAFHSTKNSGLNFWKLVFTGEWE